MAENGNKPTEGDNHEDDLETPGYKAPEKKTLEEIQKTDAEDESLNRYKEMLLGNLPTGDSGDPRNVIVLTMIFAPVGREEIVIDLTGDIAAIKTKPFVIKEGCEYKIKVVFRVQREIVAGLRLFQTTYRKGIKVDKSNLMVGSYGPKAEPHTFITAVEEAPKGMVSRGHYTVKSKFTDDDKSSHLDWEWSFDIKKDWE